MSDELYSLADELEVARRIIGRVAVLLREGKLERALDELPVTEHELIAEAVLDDERAPCSGDA